MLWAVVFGVCFGLGFQEGEAQARKRCGCSHLNKAECSAKAACMWTKGGCRCG